jgi:hypothetical protein
LEKGRYATTDVYVHHMAIAPGSRDTLILTDKRVMYIVHNDIFGGWQVLETLSSDGTFSIARNGMGNRNLYPKAYAYMFRS